MPSVPTASAEVVHAAVCDEDTATPEQPLMGFPSDVKATVPVGAGGWDGERRPSWVSLDRLRQRYGWR